MAMEEFVHQQNLLFFRKKLAEAPHEAQRLQLLKLLAEEEAKDIGASNPPYPPLPSHHRIHAPAPANAL
jgi:hypothetical protein